MTSSVPYAFNEFFDSGGEDAVSPFLTRSSRRWGRHLELRSSLASAALLILGFVLSLVPGALPIGYLLLALVYFLAGVPKLIEAMGDLLSLDINIDVLMTLAAFLSVLIGSPFEGGLLLVLFAISGSMEQTVTGKAKGALHALRKVAPSRACVLGEEGRVHQRHVNDIQVGTHVLVRAGEVAPLDGEVIRGTSSVDLVHLTGESVPIRKSIGEQVPAGARVIEGTLVLRVSATSSDSTLSRIIRLVTEAHEARPKAQRLLDRFGRTYAVSIILATFALSIMLPFVTALPYLGETGSIYRALSFLIAASPCALIIALPISYLSAIGSCARRGILMKGGITLDSLAACRSVAFDKTGTLTTGQLRCLGLTPMVTCDASLIDRALAVAQALEQHVHHPIADAVSRLAEEKALASAALEEAQVIPGFGVAGRVSFEGELCDAYIGHLDHLQERLPPDRMEAVVAAAQTLQKAGEMLSVLVIGERVWFLRFQDSPRPGIAEVVARLKEKLRVLMLTGDHAGNAESVAQQVGIQEFYADLRPEDKLQHVSRLSQSGGLAMIGDGVNDAPALARATCGISMGAVGSQTAIDAADVVLLHDNLSLLPWLWSKAHKTQTIVKQNLFLSIVAIIGASVSALAGFLPLWLAVILHEGGTVLVGLNSLRLLR